MTQSLIQYSFHVVVEIDGPYKTPASTVAIAIRSWDFLTFELKNGCRMSTEKKLQLPWKCSGSGGGAALVLASS